MTEVAPHTTLVDLEHLGLRRIIASCVVSGPAGGGVLIDPGPSSTRDTLTRKLDALGSPLADLDAILLTHIHLDHAGATGSLVRDHPHLRVYVQERGATHMADPSRLLRSAERLYGDDMERLWGELVPVPADRIEALSGGETISVADRHFEVAYTPGHASHHVSYLALDTRIAFTGDTAGMRIEGADYVEPPTPPPDISLEQWADSLRTIRAWNPKALFMTHFGLTEDVTNHLDALWKRLQAWSVHAKELLAADEADDVRAERFQEWVFREMREALPGDLAECYVQAGPPSQSFYGLARYWRKREEA